MFISPSEDRFTLSLNLSRSELLDVFSTLWFGSKNTQYITKDFISDFTQKLNILLAVPTINTHLEYNTNEGSKTTSFN